MEASAVQSVQVDMTSDVSSVTCVSSDHGTASVFCKQCHNFYCEICCGSHKASLSLNGHTVMSIGEMSRGDIKKAKQVVQKETCTEHWLPITYWCKTCRERICTTCCVFKHMGHTSVKEKLQRTETKADTEANAVLCNKRDHGRASVFCRECTCFYCETCSSLHQNFDSMGGHNITHVNTMSNTAIAHAKSLEQTPKKPDRSRGKRKQTNIPCFRIVHGEATVFCTDCNKFYCKDCSNDHQLYDSMCGHKMKPIDQVSSRERVQVLLVGERYQCRKHKTPFNIICKTCNTLMCHGCYGTKCCHHNLQTLNEAAEKAMLQLQSIIAETTPYIKEQNELLTDLRLTQGNIPISVRSAKKQIKTVAQKMRETINNHEDELLRDVDLHKTAALQTIETLINEHQASEAAAVNLSKQIERLCKFGEDIDLVEQTPNMKEKWRVGKLSKRKKMTWKYVAEKKQLTEEHLKVMFGQVQLATPTLLGNPLQQVRLKYTGDQIVSGMVVIGSSLCITHREDSNLWLYDMTTGKMNKCLVPNMEDPRGMAVLKSADRTVIITDDSNNNQLHFVNILTDLTIKYVKGKHISVERPCKITSSVQESSIELLIGQSDGSAFIVCNADGDSSKQIAVATPDKVERSPMHVERTPSGYVALMFKEKTNCIVQWMDHNGKCTKTYGSQNSKLLNQAPNIAVDNAGRVILVDSPNNRLHLVDMAGRQCQFILTQVDGINNPMCVFLDEGSGRLYVAHGQVGSMEVRAYGWPDSHTTNFQLKLSVATFLC